MIKTEYRKKLTQEQRAEIIRLKQEGKMTLQQIAIAVDVPYHAVNNTIYKHEQHKKEVTK